jgi:hypothetical protein
MSRGLQLRAQGADANGVDAFVVGQQDVEGARAAKRGKAG